MKKIYVVGMCMLLLAAMFVAAKANNVRLRDVFPYGKETAEAIRNGELLYTIDLQEGWNQFTYDSRFMPPVDDIMTEVIIQDGVDVYTFQKSAMEGITGSTFRYWNPNNFPVAGWEIVGINKLNLEDNEYIVYSYKPVKMILT